MMAELENAPIGRHSRCCDSHWTNPWQANHGGCDIVLNEKEIDSADRSVSYNPTTMQLAHRSDRVEQSQAIRNTGLRTGLLSTFARTCPTRRAIRAIAAGLSQGADRHVAEHAQIEDVGEGRMDLLIVKVHKRPVTRTFYETIRREANQSRRSCFWKTPGLFARFSALIAIAPSDVRLSGT